MPFHVEATLKARGFAGMARAMVANKIGAWAIARIDVYYVEHFVEQMHPRAAECGGCEGPMQLEELAIFPASDMKQYWLQLDRCGGCGVITVATSWIPELDAEVPKGTGEG